MKDEISYYRPYQQHGLDGFYVKIRNSMNNKIEEEFIPAGAKPIYESRFGNSIVTDEDFYDWYSENASRFDP